MISKSTSEVQVYTWRYSHFVRTFPKDDLLQMAAQSVEWNEFLDTLHIVQEAWRWVVTDYFSLQLRHAVTLSLLFLYFFPPPLFFWPYLIPTHCSVEDYCCTLSHPLTHIHLVGTFWTSKRLVAETCTCTIHKIHKRHPCPRRDSNTQSQQASERAAADVLLRPHGHRDRHVVTSQRKYSHFKWSYKYIEKRIKSCWRLEAVP